MTAALTLSNTYNDHRLATNALIVRTDNLGTYDAITLTGGNINGVTIGGSTAAAGSFTNLAVSSTINLTAATVLLANGQISGNKISGGTITSVYIELAGDPTIPSHAVNKVYLDATLGSKLDASLVSGFALTLLDDTTAAAMRTTLGLGTSATMASNAFLQPGNNLSDILNSATARANLGLGALAVKGTINNSDWSGTVLSTSNGGLGTALLAFTGPASTLKTFTLPNQNDTISTLGSVGLYTRQQNFALATLTDASNIAWDLNVAQMSKVTLGGNRILSNPSNMVAGGNYVLYVIQDGTGSRLLSFSANYIFPSGIAPILSTSPGAVDIFEFKCDGANMYSVLSQNTNTYIGGSTRNRFLNGEMQIDQRNCGNSQSITSTIAYTVDRFYASAAGANVTGQRVTGSSGYINSYRFSGATSNSNTLFGQRIESINCFDLVSKPVVGQVTVSSSSLSSVTWTAYYANAVDDFSAKTQFATGTININSTPTNYNFVFNAGANAANGICIEFTSGALLNVQTLTYTGVQLTLGVGVPPFEHRPLTQEVQSCSRYFQKSYDLEIVPRTNTANGMWGAPTNTNGGIPAAVTIAWLVPSRVTPTFSFFDRLGNVGVVSSYESGAWQDNGGTVTVVSVGTKSVVMYSSSNVGNGRSVFTHYTINAEL